ncbi:MAG TPA: bifunctional oligoribonuclease/PAP phosphatase NrnA [Candidatus Scatosoma pullicola]|nr:bifunctional oligoribonuclease/PAP phosphatase NrnA [Candidatus Scatosoma pullicola]
MNATLTEIAARIKAAKSAVILTHMRPDGDAFGSALGLSAALDRLDIPNTVCDESDIPSNLAFLEGTEKIQKQLPEAELYIAVDSSDEQRLGALAEPFRAAAKKHDTVNIDHHVSNTRFARYDFVRLCSANCMNILALVETLGVPLDKKIAGYLLLGILTDSGNFSHDDVTEETFLAAAKLTRAGADPAALNYNLFRRQPKARAELYADALGHIRWLLDDRFAVILLTLDKMKKYGADNGMTEGFVDFPLTVESVEVSASVMEVKKGQYKISLRSKKYADVNKIAGVYGGGGHVRAAGCMLFGEPEEVIDRLSYTVSQYL